MLKCILPSCIKKKRTGVYVLQLQGGKYYVGSSNDISRRIWMHENLNGAAWTKKYGVIKEKKTISNGDGYLGELVETLEQISHHGIENVRGSIFTNVNNLSENDKIMAAQLYCELKGYCRKCGYSGHYISSCNSKTKSPWVSNFGGNLEWKDVILKKECLKCNIDISNYPKYHKYCNTCFSNKKT